MFGRRTYFQESRAQLALRVSETGSAAECPTEELAGGDRGAEQPDAEEDPAEDGCEPLECPRLPLDTRLNDDTRLERVQYDEPAAEPDVSPLQQAVILAT